MIEHFDYRKTKSVDTLETKYCKQDTHYVYINYEYTKKCIYNLYFFFNLFLVKQSRTPKAIDVFPRDPGIQN